jgi:DNA repair protein RadC
LVYCKSGKEELKVMLLNRENRVLGIADVSVGGIHGTIVDPKMIFAIALKGKASSIILAHNHPSGNLELSYKDKTITAKLVQAGILLELQVADHLILTQDGYTSLADNNLI